MSLKFYIVKRDEREGDGYAKEMEFDNPQHLENYLSYNRGYIEEMQSIGIKTEIPAMPSTCADCDSMTSITLEPWGTRFMAEIACPKCGVSYDTNLDDSDIEAIKKSLLKTEEVTA
jgi:hypothetical protein